MVQFKAAYLSLGGRLLAGGSSLPLGPWITCLNIRHAYPLPLLMKNFQYEQFEFFFSSIHVIYQYM